MPKKYFLRKSPSELIQEQNRLLGVLLEKQQHSNKVEKGSEPLWEVHLNEVLPNKEDFDFSFDAADEIPYISVSTETGSAQLPNIDTNKVDFDETGVEKLKKRKSKEKKGDCHE